MSGFRLRVGLGLGGGSAAITEAPLRLIFTCLRFGKDFPFTCTAASSLGSEKILVIEARSAPANCPASCGNVLPTRGNMNAFPTTGFSNNHGHMFSKDLHIGAIVCVLLRPLGLH